MSDRIDRRAFLKGLLTSGIVLSTMGSVSTLLNGCGTRNETKVERAYDFLVHLDEAEIITPGEEYVRSTSFRVEGDKRDVIAEHPDSSITFKDIPVYRNARLKFGIGINEAAWEEHGEGILFEVIVADESKQHTVYSRYIDTKDYSNNRKWFDEKVDIRSFEGKRVSFTFKTSSGSKRGKPSNMAGWSKPHVCSEKIISLKGKRPPNILLISVDTLRSDHLGCYGHPLDISPNIDKLAGKGALFSNAIAQSPWTLPSHMSILTSLYPSVHLANSQENSKLSKERVCLAELLGEAGYYNAAFVDGGLLTHKYGYSQGFSIYDDKGGHIAKINRKAMDFVEDHFQESFFLFMHVYDVHGPYEPPSPYSEMYYKGIKNDPKNHSMDFVKEIGYHKYQKFGSITDIDYVKSLYAGEVRYVDNELGKLFARLEKLKIFDNTLIVLLSDHGESLFEHHVYVGHGILLYDNEIKIPLIIRPPKRMHANGVICDQVESIDIMPTILDLLDLPASKEAQGKSLVKLINGTKRDNGGTYAFGESSNTGGTSFVRTNKWKFISHMKEDLDETIRTHLKPSNKIDLAQYIIGGEQLYDLEHDPFERNNLVKKNAEVADRLKKELFRWEENNRKILSELRKQKIDAAQKANAPHLTDGEKDQLRALGYVQ